MTRDVSDRDARLLAGLADGALRGRRLRKAERLVAEHPDGPALIDRQRRVAGALRGGPVPPRPIRVARAPRAIRAPRASRLRPALAAGVAAAALAVIGLLVAGGIGDRTPALASVVQLSMRDAADAPPVARGPLLDAEHAGVRFPSWSGALGWRAVGERRDRVGDRDARTVFYEHQGHRIAYTVVDGPPLDPPRNARVVTRDGLRVALYRDPRHGGHDVAVFERAGRTCVLAGHVEHTSTLVRLAAWRGDGAVTF